MGNIDVIKSVAENNEDVLLLRSFLDKEQGRSRKNIPTWTKFLTQREKTLCQKLCERMTIYNFAFVGGSDDAERCVCIFYPDYLELEDCKNLPLSFLHCEKSSKDQLSHRDYLGSLMSLGIVREVIGDIYVSDKGADIVILKDIEEFLLSNFHSAGRKELSIQIIDQSELSAQSSDGTEVKINVMSFRLDCVVSALWKVSRGISSDLIREGRVNLNGFECKKGDKQVFANDRITIRGKGKAQIKEVIGTSKKGRFFVSALIYK